MACAGLTLNVFRGLKASCWNRIKGVFPQCAHYLNTYPLVLCLLASNLYTLYSRNAKFVGYV